MDRCVLVVEDEPIVRLDAVAMLEEAGLTVVEFDRADEALTYADQHRGDVAAIFTDINLRGLMSGIDLATSIARRHPGIRVLVTSGRYDKAPANLPPSARFVKKPWLPLQVLSAMQDAVAA